MLTAIVIIFVVAYAAIALEHPLKVNKSASALIGAGLLWTIYAMSTGDHHLVSEQLGESLMSTAQIVFFLMGAMTIVEVVDAHNGFEVITSRIKTTKLSTLMWLIGFVTFFLSAVLDNLTTTIVMISLIKKLLDKHDDRLFFAGIIVISANAGGAWSPIGDVTTTMLWIGGQITSLAIMKGVFLASMVNMIVPLAITSWLLKGREVVSPVKAEDECCSHRAKTTRFEQNLMFSMGIGILVAVPIFKTVTHLPPFMGILFGLGIIWLVGELLHSTKDEDAKEHLKRFAKGSLELIPGRTPTESFEIRMMRTAAETKDKVQKQVLKEIVEGMMEEHPEFNSNVMILSGSRGSVINLTNLYGMWGQASVREGRPKRGFANRLIALNRRGDVGIDAGGFIYENFMEGMSSYEYFYHAMGGRQGEVDTGVSTKVSGYLYRRLANSLKDLVVNNDFTVRTANRNIVQFKYGEDGVFPQKAFKGKSVSVKRELEKLRSK